MKVGIGSDHGGFLLKEALLKFVRAQGHECTDFGTHSADPVDYPDFAALVADAVAAGVVERGIVVDGAGIGSAIAANKVAGVRAALCHDAFTARNAREHNNANVLTLGSGVTGAGVAEEIVRLFLTTDFAGGRHQRRVNKLDDLDRRRLR